MNKFRKLGFITYNGHLEVHSSLLNVVLHDWTRSLPRRSVSSKPEQADECVGRGPGGPPHNLYRCPVMGKLYDIGLERPLHGWVHRSHTSFRRNVETLRKRYGVSQCESESSTLGRPVARSHRDRRSAGRRSGVVSEYILNKNPSASSNSVKTASPCRGTFHEKYSATYVLKSSISSIVPMEPRKDWSGVYSRVYISGSFHSLSGDRGLPDLGLPATKALY